jgi:site-specific DNA-methyltransferase (adenine-specific)
MIQLFNSDCMDIMKKYPDKYFDLSICDPPYGIGLVRTENGNRGIRKLTHTGSDVLKWDMQKPTIEYFNELFRVSKNQIVFGANHFIENIPNSNSTCWIVWDCKNGDNYFADAQLAWTSFKTATRIAKISQRFPINEGHRIHDTQKPIQLYSWILNKYAKKDFKILDTHLGSASSAIASHYFGINEFIGCEIDCQMYIKAKNRFSNSINQTKLFC